MDSEAAAGFVAKNAPRGRVWAALTVPEAAAGRTPLVCGPP